MTNSPDVSVGSNGSNEWFGHPKQLARLFTTEMWERFGYYGMRALLTLYLVNYFFFKDEVSGAIYGAFTALVYLTPLFGGLIADRYLGYKSSVKLGAIMMALGYLGLCVGNNLATPFARINGTDYTVQITKDKVEGKAVVNKHLEMDGVKYSIDSDSDGQLLLKPESGEPRKFSKGSYSFDGKRNPLWVNTMLMALSMIVIGNGFFKPNISTMVGSLYQQGDPRRDSGFSIFYMGINLGSMFSQILCPIFFETIGPWSGFALAAGGMVIAWFLFQFDGGRLAGFGEPPATTTNSTRLMIYVGAFLAVPVVWWLMVNTMNSAQAVVDSAKLASEANEATGVIGYFMALPILGKIMFTMFFAAIIGVPLWSLAKGTFVEAQKMIVATVLITFSTVFWTLFEQAGSSLTLFAERSTNLNVFGYDMPAGQTQFFNAFFIVALAPIFSIMWTRLAKMGLEPSTPVKFAIGLVLVGVGFLALGVSKGFASAEFKVPLFWLALAYFIHSVAELCLSPVGLSMITRLSMPSVVGLMMGAWFLSSAMAQYVAGIIAQFASVETVGGKVTDPGKALETYVGVFNTIGLWGCGVGVALLVLSPVLKRMMHGVR
jgi:proton-dependent oligopeptide transporter, POT family